MSHPNPSHERSNEYPEDDFAGGKPKKRLLGNTTKYLEKGAKKLRGMIKDRQNPFSKALSVKVK